MNREERPTPLTAAEFTDRVMGAIRVLPAPTPTRGFIASVRALALRDAIATLWVAWHLGTVRSWHVAPRVRARSFALVLGVASVLATGSLVAAAAVHSVVPQRDEHNPVAAPAGSSVDQGPAGNGRTSSEPSPRQTETVAPIEAPTPTDHRTITTDHEPVASPAGRHESDRDAAKGSGDGDDEHATDESDASDDAHDGSGGDQPDATDDHEGSDGPSGSDVPDDSSGTHDGSGGSGSGETPDGGGEPDAGGGGSGG
jgi:uncharacterized membrane protein YgcG